MAAPLTPKAEWTFVERASEVATLTQWLDDPSTRVIIVTGAAGVGKSRLTERVFTERTDAGGLGRRCQASSSLADVPIGALVGLIPAAQLERVAAGQNQLTVFAMVSQSIAELGATPERPFLLCIDDLHHLDSASIGLISQLVDNCPVQVLATIRTGETLPDGALALWAESGQSMLALPAFSPEQVDTLIRAQLGAATPEVRDALWHHSQGNALYLRELIVASVASRRVVLHGDTWVLQQPLTGSAHLSEYLLSAVRSLAPEARRLTDMLSMCQPLPLAMFSTAELDLLEVLERTGVVVLSADQLRLAHPMYAEVISEHLTSLTQRRILGDVIDRLERLATPADELRITVWRLEIGRASSVTELVAAARSAFSAHDLLLANRLGRAAQSMAPNDPAVALVLSDSLYATGDFAGAAEVADSALTKATDPAEQAALVASLYRTYMWGLDDADGALAVVDFALAVVGTGPGWVTLAVAAANALTFSDRPVAALERLAHLDATLDGPIVDPMDASLCQSVREAALAQIGRTGDATANDAPVLDDQGSVLSLYTVVHSFALCEHGRFDDAADIAMTLRTEVIGLSLTLDQMWAALNAARAHLFAGRLRTAIVWANDALITAQRAGLIAGEALILSVLAAAHAQLGDAAAAEHCDERAAELEHVRGFLRPERAVGRAWTSFLRGEHTRAHRQLLDAAAAAQESGQVVTESMLLYEHLRLRGQPAVERLSELASLTQSPLVAARAAHANGLRARSSDELMQAGRAFAELGARLNAAEAYQGAARCAETSRDRANGAKDARASLALAEGGSTPLLDDEAPGALALLSPREREIAELVGSGRTTREVGDRLNLSPRTVENHVARIYGKLGITSRAELARLVGR